MTVGDENDRGEPKVAKDFCEGREDIGEDDVGKVDGLSKRGDKTSQRSPEERSPFTTVKYRPWGHEQDQEGNNR